MVKITVEQQWHLFVRQYVKQFCRRLFSFSRCRFAIIFIAIYCLNNEQLSTYDVANKKETRERTSYIIR